MVHHAGALVPLFRLLALLRSVDWHFEQGLGRWCPKVGQLWLKLSLVPQKAARRHKTPVQIDATTST